VGGHLPILTTVRNYSHPALVAPVAGFLLGFLDFVWIKFVPFPFGGLGNSIAVWAVAAFLLTYHSRWTLGRAVAAAALMLVVAVPSYYLAAALIQGDNWSNLWTVTAIVWMLFGVIAGAVFGTGGVIARRPGRPRLPALALPAAILLAEMCRSLRSLSDMSGPVEVEVRYPILLAVLAVLVTVATARTWRDRGLALACAVPLALGGWLLIDGVFGAVDAGVMA
jgi:hypothetical protein